MTERRTCPDCQSEAHEIKLIDKSPRGDVDFEYTLPEAKKKFWSSTYPVEGRVLAYMCSACGRIALYGAAKEK